MLPGGRRPNLLAGRTLPRGELPPRRRARRPRRCGRRRRTPRPVRLSTPRTPNLRAVSPTARAGRPRGPESGPRSRRPTRRRAGSSTRHRPGPASTLPILVTSTLRPGDPAPSRRALPGPPSGRLWTRLGRGPPTCSMESPPGTSSAPSMPRRSAPSRRRRGGIRWRSPGPRGQSGARCRDPRFGASDPATGGTPRTVGPGGGPPGLRRPARPPHRPGRDGGGSGWWSSC